MPDPNVIIMPDTAEIKVQLVPVQTQINSLVLIARSKDLSGLSSWIYDTYNTLTPKQKETHHLVVIGLHFAIIPTRSWNDFPTYLKHLESCSPTYLRDKVLDAYLTLKSCQPVPDNYKTMDKQSLLDDLNLFLDYLRTRFGEEYVFEDIETKAHVLLNDPAKMQNLIVSHLRYMWDQHLSEEWERITPMLQDAVTAFEKTDFHKMSRLEAAKYITGQELKDKNWGINAEEVEQIRFVPSAHTGPYLGKFHNKNMIGIIFGARLPDDAVFHAPDLSRTEITVRLNALADEVRLHILKLTAQEGELRSQEIMQKIQLSQSAASRHLKQLSATGYLNERRCSGAKCYSFNAERVEDTLQAVSAFLLDHKTA